MKRSRSVSWLVYGGSLTVSMGLVFLLAVCVSTALADPRSRAPAPVAADAEIAMYEAMYERLQVPREVLTSVLADWSDADRVQMAAAALESVMHPLSREKWQPGYEEWLRTVHQLTREQIVVAVYAACAERADMLATATLTQMVKSE